MHPLRLTLNAGQPLFLRLENPIFAAVSEESCFSNYLGSHIRPAFCGDVRKVLLRESSANKSQVIPGCTSRLAPCPNSNYLLSPPASSYSKGPILLEECLAATKRPPEGQTTGMQTSEMTGQAAFQHKNGSLREVFLTQTAFFGPMGSNTKTAPYEEMQGAAEGNAGHARLTRKRAGLPQRSRRESRRGTGNSGAYAKKSTTSTTAAMTTAVCMPTRPAVDVLAARMLGCWTSFFSAGTSDLSCSMCISKPCPPYNNEGDYRSAMQIVPLFLQPGRKAAASGLE